MLVEMTILVPMQARSQAVREGITERVIRTFGGCTWLPAQTVGFWVDPSDGSEHVDRCDRLVVAVDSFGDMALVVAVAREIGGILGERSMYVGAFGMSECVEVGR